MCGLSFQSRRERRRKQCVIGARSCEYGAGLGVVTRNSQGVVCADLGVAVESECAAEIYPALSFLKMYSGGLRALG